MCQIQVPTLLIGFALNNKYEIYLKVNLLLENTFYNLRIKHILPYEKLKRWCLTFWLVRTRDAKTFAHCLGYIKGRFDIAATLNDVNF